MSEQTISQLEAARSFMKEQARAVDLALFEYEFEAGSADAVLQALRAYQNEDGGFGKGLEPDIRCAASSAYVTTIGLQYLARVGADEDHEMVQKAIGYLLSTFNSEKIGWDIVPPAVEQAPRAPWWNYEPDREDWGNPNAEIVGYLLKYSKWVPAEMLDRLTDHAIKYLERLENYEFHELLCYLRLQEQLPESLREKVAGKIKAIVEHCVTVDPAQWEGYGLQPIQVVTSPASPFYSQYADVVQKNVEHLASKQTESGCWEPTWTWGGLHEELWEQAKVEWSGRLTVDHLLTLRAFDRL